MDFIGQSWGALTTGGKIYLGVQALYIGGAIFFTYVQIQILKELRRRK